MRRLTLILSDLYLPEDASDATTATWPEALPLPGLSSLLRWASKVTLPDWRRWVAAQLGSPALAEIPIAQIAAHAFDAAGPGSDSWLATPVHLAARLDHVRLVDRGLLTVAADERRALCEDFARQFGPKYQLHSGSGREFLLTGLAGDSIPTIDPARLLDADVAPALPRGKAADEMRRLGAEIEMWLHASTLNAARERAGAPRISTLWLWGGGLAVPATGNEAQVAELASAALHGRDSFLAGLARLANAKTPAPVPAGLQALDPHVPHHVVEFAPMSGAPHDSLESLDEHWFVPARAALAAGRLSALEIVANDTCFRISRSARWRFWRPRRTWLENLALGARARRA